MTSTNDGKDVKNTQKSGQKGKSYYIELYKSLEARLSGEGDLHDRTRALCEAWRSIHTLCQHAASATHPHLITWILRHTAKTVLQSEWSKSKDEHASLHSAIEDYVSECRAAAASEEEQQQWREQLLQRAQWFQRVLGNPWEHPILIVLLNPSSGQQPTDEDVLRWLKEERGVMFVTRLRQLAAARLAEAAAALAGAVMGRVRAHSPPVPDAEQTDNSTAYKPGEGGSPSFAETLRLEAGFTEDVWEMLTDIEFVLLHKLDKARCIELAKQTPLCDGYKLVERLRSRLETSPREKKLWKNAKDVATLVAQMLVARCMVVPQCSGVARVTLYCCARSLVRLVSAERLPAETTALAALAATARHLHTFAAAVDAQCEDKKFVCELYVRAITAGMNELERLKLKTEKQSEARAAEQTLAAWFTQLAELLAGSARLKCECTLTAFSVHPSLAMYERIRAAPALPQVPTDVQEWNEESTSEFGSWANDSRSQTNLVKTSETLNLKQSRQQTNVLSTAVLAEGEAMGLAPDLCQDLAVLLSGPRVKTLSWDMNREALLMNCQRYMERTHGGTRALTRELKYLNLDPAKYQHLPEEDDGETDVYYGIEKGYEHLVEFAPEPEQIWDDRLDPEKTETAESDYSEEISISRTKNKSTRPTLSSDDDSDPLSRVKENKKHEIKKERPHSKERSKKHRRKNKDKSASESLGNSKEGGERTQGHINEKCRKKKKCKNKKKKEKEDAVDPLAIDIETQSNLSNLVGLKVVRIEDKEEKLEKKKVRKNKIKSSKKNPHSVTDSDYDSQGLTSLNSEDTETDVLFDGLFSMEDMKSPEKSAVAADKMYNDSLLRNGEFTISNGEVAINKAPSPPKSDVTQIKNKVKHVEKIQVKPVIIGVKKSAPVTNTKRLFPDFKSTVSTSQKYVMNDKGKRSIAKLLQFRKQRNSMLLKTNPIATSTSNSSERIDNIQLSESVKETTTAIPSVISCDSDIIDNNNFPGSCINPISVIQKSNIAFENDAKPILPESTSPKSTDTNKTQLLSSTARKSPNDRLAKVPDTPHQQHFYNFLEEFHRSTISIKDKSESGIIRNEVKPISRLIPVPAVGASQQGAKLLAQNNKIESAPNTFARLSYLHKSKQSETKMKANKPPTKSADDFSKEVQQELENQSRNSFMHDNKQIETAVKINKPVMKSADDLSKDLQKEKNIPNLLCFMNKSKQFDSVIIKTNKHPAKSDELSKNVQMKLVNKPNYITDNNQNETAIEEPMPTTKRADNNPSEDVQQEQKIYNHRSHMHENKQSQTKIKVSAISSDDLSKDVQNVTYLKQQGISVTRVSNHQKETIAGASNIIQGTFVAAPSVTREKHPTLTNILESNSFKPNNLFIGVNTSSLDKTPPNQTKSGVKSTYVQSSSLSERDHHDLLLLLRQKNKLISPSQTDITRIPQNFSGTALSSKIPSTQYTTVSSNKLNISSTNQTENTKNQLKEYHNKTVSIKNINIQQPLVNSTGYRNQNNVIKIDNFKTENLVNAATSKTIHENIAHSNLSFNDSTSNVKTDPNNKLKEDWRSVMKAILSHKTPIRGQTTDCKTEPPAIAHESKVHVDNIITEKDIDKTQVTLHSQIAERNISLDVSDNKRIPESKTIDNMSIKTSQQNTTALLNKKSATTTIMRLIDTAQAHQSKNIAPKQRKTILLDTPPEFLNSNLCKNKSLTPVTLKENPGIQLNNNNVEYKKLPDKSVGHIDQVTTQPYDNSMTRSKKELPKIKINSIKNCRSVNAINTSPLMTPALVKIQNSSSKSSSQMDIKKCVPETINKIADQGKNKPQNKAQLSEQKIENKKNLFTCEVPKEIDPFVSEIQNSDYDLLEELMDDDLRQEIGELSDEEIYSQVPFTLSKDINKIKNVSNNIETSTPLYRSSVTSAQKLPVDCQKHFTDEQILMKPVKQEFLQKPYHTGNSYTANEMLNVGKKGWMVDNFENLSLSITDNVNQSHIPKHMSENSKPFSVPSNLINVENNGDTNNQTTFSPGNLYIAPIVQQTSLQNVVVIQGLHMQGSVPSINIINTNQKLCVELNSTSSTNYTQPTLSAVPPVITTVINNIATIQTNNNAVQIDSSVSDKVAEDMLMARLNLKASNMKQDDLLAPNPNPKLINEIPSIKPTNATTQIGLSGCNKVVKDDKLTPQTNFKISKNTKQDNLLTTCQNDRIPTAVTNIASINAAHTVNQAVSSECINVVNDVLATRPDLKIFKKIRSNLIIPGQKSRSLTVLNPATLKITNNTDEIDSSGCNKFVEDDMLAARLNVNISRTKQDDVLTPSQINSILKDTEKNSRSEKKPVKNKDDVNFRRHLDTSIGNSEVLSHVQDSNKQMQDTESKTKNAKNQERLKNKRQSIMNREINKSCFYPPIPLSYTPLQVMKTEHKVNNLEGIQIEIHTSNSQYVKTKIDVPTETIRKRLVDQSVNFSNTSSLISDSYKDINNDLTRNVDLNTLNDYIDVENPENKSKNRLKRKFIGTEHKESTNINTIETHQPDQNNTPVTRRRISRRITDKSISNSICTQLQSEENVIKTNVDEKVMQTEESTKDFAVSEECRILSKPDSLHEKNVDEKVMQTEESTKDYAVSQECRILSKPDSLHEKQTDMVNIDSESGSDDFDENKEKQNEFSLNSSLEVTGKNCTKITKKIRQLSNTQPVSNLKKVNNVMCKQLPQKCTNKRKKIRKRSHCGNINPGVKNLLKHNLNEQDVQNNLEKSYTDTDEDKLTAEKMFQKYKKGLSIEELPSVDPKNPLKKMVRIKLANGKAYKVTICGKLQDNYDKLFENPHIKSLLYNDFNDNKRYTVNIRQTSTVLHDTKKVVKTSIQAINVEKKLTDNIQTVNLISDDDEEDCQSFTTEFGSYIVRSTLDSNTFSKHQKKLSLKCSVKLSNISYDAESQYVTPMITSGVVENKCEDTTFSTVLEANVNRDRDETLENRDKESIKDLVKLTNNPFDVESQYVTPIITSEVVKNKCEDINFSPVLNANVIKEKDATLEKLKLALIESVVENSETGNSQTMSVKKSEGKKAIDADFDTSRQAKENITEVIEIDSSTDSDSSEFPVLIPKNPVKLKSDDKINQLKKVLLEELVKNEDTTKDTSDFEPTPETFRKIKLQADNLKQCSVTVSKCDDLVKKYEQLKLTRRKCFIELTRCDDIYKNDHTIAIDSSCSSTNASDMETDQEGDKIIQIQPLESLHSPNKLTRCGSFSILSDLPTYNDEPVLSLPTLFENDISSPVMEAFDNIAASHNVYLKDCLSYDISNENKKNASIHITDTLENLIIYGNDECVRNNKTQENQTRNFKKENVDDHLLVLSKNLSGRAAILVKSNENQIISISCSSDIFYTKKDIRNSLAYVSPFLKVYHSDENPTENQFQNRNEDDVLLLNNLCDIAESESFKSDENQFFTKSCSFEIFSPKYPLTNSIITDSNFDEDGNTYKNEIKYSQIQKENIEDITFALSNDKCETASVTGFLKSDINDSHTVEDYNSYEIQTESEKGDDDTIVLLSNLSEDTCETKLVNSDVNQTIPLLCSSEIFSTKHDIRDSIVKGSYAFEECDKEKKIQMKIRNKHGNDVTTLLSSNFSKSAKSEKLHQNKIVSMSCSSDIFFTKHSLRDSIVYDSQTHKKNLQNLDKCGNCVSVVLSHILCDSQCLTKSDENESILSLCSSEIFLTKGALRKIIVYDSQIEKVNITRNHRMNISIDENKNLPIQDENSTKIICETKSQTIFMVPSLKKITLTYLVNSSILDILEPLCGFKLNNLPTNRKRLRPKRKEPETCINSNVRKKAKMCPVKLSTDALLPCIFKNPSQSRTVERNSASQAEMQELSLMTKVEEIGLDKYGLNNKQSMLAIPCDDQNFERKVETIDENFKAIESFEKKLDNTCGDISIKNQNFDKNEYNSTFTFNALSTDTEKEASSDEKCSTEIKLDLNRFETSFEASDSEFNVVIPTSVYRNKCLKRKWSMKANGSSTGGCIKKYRKSKDIDCTKLSKVSMKESAYEMEYKRLFSYFNSIKFSYSLPFHKEYIDVHETLKDWPIQNAYNDKENLEESNNIDLFSDINFTQKTVVDPLQQTLAEEIATEYEETQNPPNKNKEYNFNMGFGEGSDRVIQNLEELSNVSKLSAATLSDVKQSQPFLLSEDYDNMINQNIHKKAIQDQVEKIRRHFTYIKLRNKIRNFFRKSAIELTQESIREYNKDKYKNEKQLWAKDFPYDLCSLDFVVPAPAENVVHVVQVGQLPVSAAAQNPITCDPRVTHVSDASPSQYSVENSSNDESPTAMKTEYTELTTADLTLPIVQEYDQQKQSAAQSPESNTKPTTDQETSVETEIGAASTTEVDKDEISTTASKQEQNMPCENNELMSLTNCTINNIEYSYDRNTNNSSEGNQNIQMFSPEQLQSQQKQNGSSEKTDQIAHAMNAAGITTSTDTLTSSRAHALVNIISQKIRQNNVSTTQASSNNYPKATSINAMALQQALAQILPPPLNQTNAADSSQQASNTVTPQVLHIVQGKNASGNQITLVDNSQQSVINAPNATQVLHIVQNKSGNAGGVTNNTTVQQSFSGLSLVDAGLQQGGNQLLHIVNTSNQKNSNAGQLLKRVNLLTNLTNVQGSNEQKMVQFVCKSADGKSIQLNAPQQRSMVLRLQPIETPTTTPKQAENQDAISITASTASTLPLKETITSQQEIKSRSVYEENYAKFIQSSSNKQPVHEKSTSLPKFNQAFGKPVFQESNQKQNDMNTNSHLPVNTNNENTECQASENAINLEHIGQISSPPLLLRKSPQASQSQSNLVQHIKQTLAPMNLQTMHGGVIYTRQIPVNIGGGQTINLITVPSTELLDDSAQKQSDLKFVNQGDMEPSIIKIVPQSQPSNSTENSSEESNNNMGNVTADSQNPQPQPVLTQMRIKLPMLSKTPTMVPGARVMRPSFFQIQRNVIGGTNQPVYQQLVLTAAPPLGQQTIRIPQTQTNRPLKVPSENQSESQMSTSTLEQLREFDMVLEQVKERSTVQPSANSNNTFGKLHTQSTTDSTDGAVPASSTVTETTQQVLYSINNQPLNIAYVNRKSAATPTTSTSFVRSPDSSGIADSPTSSTHVQIPHTVTTESSNDANSQPKAAKVGSKSKSRPKSSSNPPSSMKINTVPPKTSTQKPLEDEQTTQRILYILAEYKEQVENSPDKDKPAPRRRSNPPSNPSGSSKRKKSSSGSRRPGARDMSPVHGDDTCRTMGSEDSSCGTSQGDCNESCLDSHSPQDSPRKVVRKITFENETPAAQPRPQPPRNVIVADGQTITVARGTAGKPATAVLMPANYILPVSMVKGGQQIAIVTNRGPKLLTVGGGEGGATNALLLQRLIGPAGLKPVLARPGVRHVRLPTAALHNLQAFNLASASAAQASDSGASPAPAPTPDPVDAGAASSPWADRDAPDVKPERGSSPEAAEPWSLQSTADPRDYTYEETRGDNMDRTVLDPIPDRYSPDMEAQRIFDKMFEVETKKSYIADAPDDSPRCGAYDVDASDCEDKSYHHQVTQKKDGGSQRQGGRLAHVSAAALRHKYAILEHELRLQKSLSEECEDLGVDSPSASELFPEAELLFAASPAHDHEHATQPNPMGQGGIPQPDMDDQTATDQLLARGGEGGDAGEDVHLAGLGDVGGVGVVAVGGGGGVQPALALDHEEFARAHPNTTFHSEPTDGEVQPFTISGLKGRHMTSTIFHSSGAPATVLMAAPPATVISHPSAPKYDMRHMIGDMSDTHVHARHDDLNLASVLVKDDRLTRFDTILTDARELHLTDPAPAPAAAAAHPGGNAAQVIRRVRDSEPGYLMGEDSCSRDATLESAPDDRSTPERPADLFWETNSAASERSEGRRPLDYSSDSDKCCKSPSGDDTNSTDESSGLGARGRLHSVIKDARRGRGRSGSAGGSSAEDAPPPLRTYPPKRMYHGEPEGEGERSVSGKTRAGERSPDGAGVRRRASGRGVVKRGCHCCNGSPAPLRPKKPRQRKHNVDFNH